MAIIGLHFHLGPKGHRCGRRGKEAGPPEDPHLPDKKGGKGRISGRQGMGRQMVEALRGRAPAPFAFPKNRKKNF